MVGDFILSMKFKSINIRKVDLLDWKYGFYITHMDWKNSSAKFWLDDFVTRKRGDEVDINFPDTIYNFLLKLNLISKDDTKIEIWELSSQIWDFNRQYFYIASSDYGIVLKVTWFWIMKVDGAPWEDIEDELSSEKQKWNKILWIPP